MNTILDKTLDWLQKQEDCFEKNVLVYIVENIYNGNIDTNCTYNFNSTDLGDCH